MAQLFRYFQGDPVVTSSPTEVRMWVEDLDYNFLLYGEIFESAEINGEKLLNITRKQLIDLGITRVDHQDILLKAVARLRKKAKLEEQAMQREDQNVKKMPTRFGKESEQLELAIERVLESISERRLARSLDGSSEHPPHNILTAILELINKVTMMLNILERPPFDCMSEFSSLKSHLIKHITLLKHFSEQSDISHEMESDIIDVCKSVTKMCRYIISLPPDLPRPDKQSPGPAAQEERPRRVQVPVTTESEIKSSSMKRKPDYTPLIRHLTVPMTSTILSYELPVLYMSGPNQRASESSSLQRANTPSDEGAVSQECDKGNKSETEVPDTEASETLSGSFHYKTFQDLTIIESDTPIDSGSERCVLGSDSDRGVDSDDDFEQHSRSSGSEICGVDSGYIKSFQESDFTKHLFKTEKYQIDFGSVEDLTKPGQHLVRVEQCQMDSESWKHWLHSGSEKCFEDSDSEEYLDSDNERKKEEKRQMVSDSIKRLMESEQKVMESEIFWMNPDSESYVVESDKERGRIVAASTSKIHLLLDEGAEKPRSKRYMQDSDSDTYEMDSDSERHKLASAAVKCLVDTKTFQLSTSTDKQSQLERRTVNSDSESPGMASSSVKLLKKAGMCQSTCNLERLQVDHKSEYLQHWLDSERKQLEFDHGRHQDSSEKYEYGTVRSHGSSGIRQDERQTFQSIFERDESQVGSGSETHQTHSGSERDQNEAESTRDLIKTESRLEKEEFQMNEERKGHLMEPDKEKGHTTELDNEQYCHDSENEAHRLGARKKGNRPPGFWRPIPLPLQPGQGKEAEEQQSVQQTYPRASSIQLMKSKSEDKQLPQEKLREKHSYSSCPDSCTFMDNKYQRKAGCKISAHKRQCKEFRPAHSSQSFRSQISTIPLSSEIHGSNVSASSLNPTSASPKCVIRKKTRRSITYSLDTGTQRCAKCRMEISKSLFHKCPMDSDDSDSDSPLPAQISFDSKHSLSSKTLRHYKPSRNSPSQSLDPKHPVGIHCPRHMEDSRYSLDSTSYLHCESCSALKNLKGSSVTRNLRSKNVMSQHNIHGQVKATPVMLSKSESKFNLTARLQREDKDKLDSATKISEPEKKADVKYKLLSKDETDDDDETNTEDETDDEDETNSENEDNTEDNTKDKKDPKDKSDPDDSDPKDGNSENNTDSNNGSDPSNATGPTSGPDSSNDADPQNETDHNSDSDAIFDNATNSDVNLKYSTDEDTCADNSDNASGLADDATQHYTIDSKGSINPNCTSRNQTKAVLDFISSSNNDVDHRNVVGQGNYFFPKNIGLIFNSLDFNNEVDPKSFNPQNNTSAFQKNLDSNYNTKPSNSNNNNLNNTADPKYGTKLTNITSHKYVVALSYYLDNNCVTGFTHEVKFIFVVNPKCFNRNSYLASPNFAVHTITATDTNNTINLSGAISSHFATGKSYASDAKHLPRFIHCNVFNIIINPNYNDINIQSIHNSDSIRNNNLPDPELEIISIFSILKIAYGNIPNFAADPNYSSFPDYLVTSKFHDPPELGRAYINFDDQNIGVQFQDSAGGMDSVNSKHATGSMDAPDAKESGFLKDFSRVQNLIGIKNPATSKVLSNPNISLPSSNVVVEAELPDVVKFVISPGALNHFCKWKLSYFRDFQLEIPPNQLLFKNEDSLHKLSLQTGSRKKHWPLINEKNALRWKRQKHKKFLGNEQITSKNLQISPSNVYYILCPLYNHAFIVYCGHKYFKVPCENCSIHLLYIWQALKLGKGHSVVLSCHHIKIKLIVNYSKCRNIFQPEILLHIFCILKMALTFKKF